MDVERSSLCNCVVNFLLEENYLLTAFELLHELLEDGRDNQAIRLKQFFSDHSRFPPDQISRYHSLRVADPQTLLEEKEATEEKHAISEYELRLAQEDIAKLKSEIQKKTEIDDIKSESYEDISENKGHQNKREERSFSFSNFGPMKDNERRDLNCAIKEYLLIAGYKLTAMTFYEEVTDQDLDIWQTSPACVPDALRHYYYEYLSSSSEAAEEKFSLLRENESLKKSNKLLNVDNETLLKNKESADAQIGILTKSLEVLQKDLKDKEQQVQTVRQTLEHQRKELNDCRSEITALKMHIEGSRLGFNTLSSDVDNIEFQSLERYKEEIKLLKLEIENLKFKCNTAPDSIGYVNYVNNTEQTEEKFVVIHEDKGLSSNSMNVMSDSLPDESSHSMVEQTVSENGCKPKEAVQELSSMPKENVALENGEGISSKIDEQKQESSRVLPNSENLIVEAEAEKGLGTIQILADALPKIVPYVLINHREQLLPLMMCAIERHPDSNTRDSLTHTLFNLIKRPDEQQRRIIMDACVSLAKNVGEMRTEMELLPQCWEQINHMYEERRLLVAQSCGELAGFVRPEIRDSLILSIVQQLLEDSATVVREAAARNLALLLPLFPNTDKYFKVEELMFQLVCDPSGVVVDIALKELVPAVIKWGNKLDHVLRVLLSHILRSAMRCPPLSGVEGSMESHFRVLGERERWNIDILLRMLAELLPSIYEKAIETCPFSSTSDGTNTGLTSSVLQLYAGGNIEWSGFEWMHVECLPTLIQLACLLPQKEDNLRMRIKKFLLSVSERYGESYLTHIMVPVFMVAVGDDADLTFFPSTIHSRIKGLRPRTAVAGRLSTLCVLPLLLAGILGAPSKHKELEEYLRKQLVQVTADENHLIKQNSEIVEAVRFLCANEENHGLVFNILWEMVVSSNINMKIRAANLLKAIVPYIDTKVASTHVLPALVTFGSDPDVNVKHSSIDAFGAVAQHFKNDIIVDKIRVQMDAFLEDGSHESTIAVVRALVVAVPHTTDKLRDYLLSKLSQLTAIPPSATNLIRRREKANAFCEAIRALDATDISATSVRDYLLPSIHNLLKDSDALDPAHKEALEIILKERSGGTLDSISKVMGAHLGIASSVTSFFGEGGLLGKKDTTEPQPPLPESPKPIPPPPAEDTRFRRIMRGGFADMLRAKKTTDETPNQ